jgi:hypothetical protein
VAAPDPDGTAWAGGDALEVLMISQPAAGDAAHRWRQVAALAGALLMAEIGLALLAASAWSAARRAAEARAGAEGLEQPLLLEEIVARCI